MTSYCFNSKLGRSERWDLMSASNLAQVARKKSKNMNFQPKNNKTTLVASKSS